MTEKKKEKKGKNYERTTSKINKHNVDVAM